MVDIYRFYGAAYKGNFLFYATNRSLVRLNRERQKNSQEVDAISDDNHSLNVFLQTRFPVGDEFDERQAIVGAHGAIRSGDKVFSNQSSHDRFFRKSDS